MFFIMCQIIGLPPTSTIGFGLNSVSSRKRVPRPPASKTAFTFPPIFGVVTGYPSFVYLMIKNELATVGIEYEN